MFNVRLLKCACLLCGSCIPDPMTFSSTRPLQNPGWFSFESFCSEQHSHSIYGITVSELFYLWKLSSSPWEKNKTKQKNRGTIHVSCQDILVGPGLLCTLNIKALSWPWNSRNYLSFLNFFFPQVLCTTPPQKQVWLMFWRRGKTFSYTSLFSVKPHINEWKTRPYQDSLLHIVPSFIKLPQWYVLIDYWMLNTDILF